LRYTHLMETARDSNTHGVPPPGRSSALGIEQWLPFTPRWNVMSARMRAASAAFRTRRSGAILLGNS
jgi:hypothetical protein